jgi:hypothetical protein
MKSNIISLTSKISLSICLLVTLIFIAGCNRGGSEIVEDPLSKPYSLGPNSAPNVVPPTSNPPSNE